MKNPNPAFGAHLEPFHGIPSFMRLPVSHDLQGVEVAVAGVPFDSGTSFRSGTRLGPRAIRAASLLLWGYNAVLGIKPLEHLSVLDYGDLEVIPVDIRASMESVTRQAGEILAQDVTLIVLGGDHSISLPLLRAHAAKYGPLAVVHFDSHPDTWQEEFSGQPYSHGTPFRRAIEENLIDVNAYLQVGLRGPTSASNDLEDAHKLGAKTITIGQVFEMGIPVVIESIRQTVGTRPVYVSLDIDAVDPAFAPGTGTPEVGGLSSFQMLQLVRGLKGLNLVGFDLVEVSPPYDHSEITAILAANLVFEFLSLLALRKRDQAKFGIATSPKNKNGGSQ
ncbi:MAG: agmatinase [Chloroflexota bacterium]